MQAADSGFTPASLSWSDEARRGREEADTAHETARSLAEEEFQRRLKALKDEHARRLLQACPASPLNEPQIHPL
jgi:hypothetical protein